VVAGNLEAGEGRVADADSQVAVASQQSRSGINASQAAVERENAEQLIIGNWGRESLTARGFLAFSRSCK
jgi:DNA-directed RNA polymerase alpha subunit